MKISYFVCKVFIAISMLGISADLSADWMPQDYLVDLKDSDFQALSDRGFVSLKAQVSDTLKGSWCSQEKVDLLMDLVCLTHPQVCVDIGAFTGSSVLPVAATLKYLNNGKTFAVDAFSNEVATRNMSKDDPNRSWWSTVDMKAIRKLFNQMTKTWNLSGYCTLLAEDSYTAIDKIPEIDFLHIDGDYSEKGSLSDVEKYLPKVKSGGYILLSNLFIIVNNSQPKLKAFCALFDSCEMVCEIERDNAVLFKKI